MYHTYKYSLHIIISFILFFSMCGNNQDSSNNDSPPDTPGNLQAVAVSSSQINLLWTDNSSQETGFLIERSPDTSFKTSEQIQAASNIIAYNNTALCSETTYHYRIKALGSTTDSAYSPVVTATTQTFVPTIPMITTNSTETGQAIQINFKEGPEMDRGTGKPMYAIWIEDNSGAFIQNIYVCNSPATNIMRFSGGWVARPEALPYWTHKACVEDPYKDITDHNTTGMYLALPSSEPGGPIPVDLDAVSGATVYDDFSITTKRKNDGITSFRIILEINRSFDYNEYYTGTDQPSLVYAADIDLNSGVDHYTMKVIGSGHQSGSDGELYTAQNHTTALDIIEVIEIRILP